MSAITHLLVLPFLVAAAPKPPQATSDYDVVDMLEVSSGDEDLAAALEPGERACGVWRSDLGNGRTAVLAAFCFEPENAPVGAVARWTLLVVRTKDPSRRLARVVLESNEAPYGCGARGMLRVREDALPGERVLEVGWGCRSEGDGTFPVVELWRFGPKGLTRIFRMPSSTGVEPDGTGVSVSWRPASTPQGDVPSVEVTWGYLASFGAEGAWSGEQRLLFRFDGSTFRPPPGALLQVGAYASSWLPPSSIADYAPPRALDDRADTAWCAKADPRPSLSVSLAEPTRLRALRIVPGYAKSEAAFHDNARITRVHVEASGAGRPASFEATLADAMRSQEVPIPADAGAIQWITVTVLEVRPGRRYQDVCISDLRVVPRAPAVR